MRISTPILQTTEANGDAFRQIDVVPQAPTRRRFRLRAYILERGRVESEN